MPFKPFYGSCILCPPEKTVLVVAKRGLCKYHNDQRKNKAPRPKKKIEFKKKQLKYGQCIRCPENSAPKLLETKYLCRYHNIEKKKQEKSNKIVKLVDRAEKKKSIPKLVHDLDTVFSLFIRLRDSDKDGFGRCVTCSTIKHYTRMDCGHFITRGEYSIRWDPFNTAIQCKQCNGFKGGEQVRFKEAINKRWGPNTAENLEIKRHFSKKLDRFELQFLISEYTEKANALMQEKSHTK